MGHVGSKVTEIEEPAPEPQPKRTTQPSLAGAPPRVLTDSVTRGHAQNCGNVEVSTVKETQSLLITGQPAVHGRTDSRSISTLGVVTPPTLAECMPIEGDSAGPQPQHEQDRYEMPKTRAATLGPDVLFDMPSGRPLDVQDQPADKGFEVMLAPIFTPPGDSSQLADSPRTAVDSTAPKVLEPKTRLALKKLSIQLAGIAEDLPVGWEAAPDVLLSPEERLQNRRNIQLAILRLRQVKLPESLPVVSIARHPKSWEVDNHVDFVHSRPADQQKHTPKRALKRDRDANDCTHSRTRKSRRLSNAEQTDTARWLHRPRRLGGLWKGWDSMF